jgi:hypothetical protein
MTDQDNNPGQQPDNSVSGYYENYSDTQKEVLAIEIRKTRNVLFTIAAIVFASDLLGLAILNAFVFEAILIILIVPAILIGLGFLAVKEPLTAIIIAAVIIVGVWVYTIIAVGGSAAITGWLVKAIIIYFLIAGLQHAKEAMRIKKELGV